MNLEQKNVLVFGSGISGIGAAKLLERRGARVTIYDGNTELDKERILQKFQRDSGVQVLLGELPKEVMDVLDLVVISPGVPTDLPIVLKIKENNVPIWGEIELAYVCGKGDVLAITGTNGKTTTTALLGKIMEAYREEVFVVGNIGNPYTSVVDETTERSVIVAEISSFQLETVRTFRPRVSAVLNITPDHLDRHHTLEAYIGAKFSIAENQTAEDTCVLNYEDEATRTFGEQAKTKVLYFSSQRKLERGIYLDEGEIIYKNDAEEIKICHVDELQLLGTHNYENVMAAAAMALAYGVPAEVVRDTVKRFGGVEHRIEYVCEKGGVAYYNDSKGTNPDAAIKGIQAMRRPTILIGGGYDKNASYEEWIRSFEGRVRFLVLLGQTREKIAEAAGRCGFEQVVFADTLEEAVETSARLAKEGDAVLLSPACASWGMFKNYEERGDKFKELVNNL